MNHPVCVAHRSRIALRYVSHASTEIGKIKTMPAIVGNRGGAAFFTERVGG
jgi:hypothetical protein